ncbi:MAG: hypothetical protein CL878_11100 [Dehalococcoidia bacterium]|nr:hypothetical protein [Dehalococcoidia bacterium]
MVSRVVDPITLEVIRNGLESLVDKMALTVMRTAHSGVVKDAMDYSTAFCDRRGQIVAQGLTLVLHLGSFPAAVRSVLAKYGDSLAPGDMFVLNDPYLSGGIHLPDIYVIKPVFIEDALQGFSCVVAHHTDVGGIVPGSNATHSTEIYQEGLRIPTLRLYRRGVLDETITTMIARNVRLPEKVLGDLRAEIAAATIGEQAFQEPAGRYGGTTLQQYMDALLDYSERLAREEIRDLPDGTYAATGFVEGDSILSEPVTIQVALTIHRDEVTVDFDGSSPQVLAGINSPLPFSKSAAYGAIRLILDPAIPSAEGYQRAITVHAPGASVVNPRLPAACGARGITGFRIIDTVLAALAQAVPDRVPADGDGGNTIISIGGYEAGSRPFAYVDLIAGTRGGQPTGDGSEGVPHPGANVASTPAEIAEVETPVRIEEYGLLPDTGGAGKYRGALAQVRQVRCLADEAILQIRSDKRRFPPYGLQGGRQGTASWNILNPGEKESILPTLSNSRLTRDDVLRHIMAGGGGWGDPLDRDPELVQADVWNEKISIGYARREYGVIIDPDSLQVDRIATEHQRRELRDGRPRHQRRHESGMAE